MAYTLQKSHKKKFQTAIKTFATKYVYAEHLNWAKNAFTNL